MGQRPARARVQLTRRDQALLKYLGFHKFITVDQLLRVFFPKSKEENHNHYRRLRCLIAAGFVTNLVGDSGVHLGYRLDRRGRAWVKRQGDSSRGRAGRRPMYKTAYGHDIALNDVCDILQGCACISEMVFERQLRSRLVKRHGFAKMKEDGFKVPDAFFRMLTVKYHYKVVLELEFSQKSEERYVKLFSKLATDSEWDVVFIVVRGAKLRAKMEQMWAHAREKDIFIRVSSKVNQIYFADYEEFLEKKLEAKFTGDKNTFTLAGLEHDLKEEFAKQVKTELPSQGSVSAFEE